MTQQSHATPDRTGRDTQRLEDNTQNTPDTPDTHTRKKVDSEN